MSEALVANPRDADKIPENIKDGIVIDSVVGDYVGGLLNVNLKPVGYKGTGNSVGDIYTQLKLGTTQYNGFLWFASALQTFTNVGSSYSEFLSLIKLDPITGIITQYNINGYGFISTLPYTDFRINGTIIYLDINNAGNEHTYRFDMSSSVSRTQGVRTALGVSMTNSEVVSGNTFESYPYHKFTTNNRYSGFYIS